MLSIHREHIYAESPFSSDLLFCKQCGCVSNKNKTTIKPAEFALGIDTDPFAAFSAAKDSNILFLNPQLIETNSDYLNNRIKGISIIKLLATKYELDEKIYHSTIYLLDCIYLQFKFEDEIKRTAAICLILVTKYLDDGKKGCLIENDLFRKKNDYSYSKSEAVILGLIDYNLNYSTAYDILSILLHNGIMFEDDNISILNKTYITCLIQLNALVERQYIVYYTPYQVAFAIVMIARELYGLSPRHKLFEQFYNVNLASYSECLNCIKSKIHVKKAKLATKPNVQLQHSEAY